MSAWLALVFVDVVAVASLARCFTGPGELTAALASLLAAHLAGFASRLSLRGHRRGWKALGVAAAVLLPIGIVLGSTFFSGVPGVSTSHALDKDLRAAWNVFYLKVAPVPELPGLVLVTAWAAGAAGLLAELISSKRRIPAVFALTPAVAIYLFACALGTGGWRVVGLACMAGFACWYLVAVVSEREGTREVLVAVLDASPRARRHSASRRAGAVVLRMAVLAAVAAALIGPNLPGARSAALVAWHGLGGRSTKGTTVAPGSGPAPRGIEINTLVQVGQEEVDDPSVALFQVYSSVRTLELIAAFDNFDGTSWSVSPAGRQPGPGGFATSLGADEQEPPALAADGPGHAKLVQVFKVAGLGGHYVPSWGVPVGIDDVGSVSRDGPGGSIVSGTALREGLVYAVSSAIADPSTPELEAASTDTSQSQYLQLPAGLPPRLVALADRIVSRTATPYAKALALVAYLTSSSFHYRLPSRSGLGAASSASAYSALVSFLFKSRTGYCQQFATAFAVLARIDGLPTRIAVGFQPGSPLGHDEWQVEGSDTHAWPQVLFKQYGWIDFEPTPGTTAVGTSGPGVSTTTRPTIATSTVTTAPPHNRSSTGGATGPGTRERGAHKGSGPPAALWLVIPFALLAWAGGVLLHRRLMLTRSRAEPRAGVLAAWGEALRILDLAGIRRRRGETCLELATRVSSAGVLSEAAEVALKDLARLATSAGYAAMPPGDAGLHQAVFDAKTVGRSARRRVARWQLVVAAFDPRAFLG
jgi:transglutaminase-like putative cysteine protease